MKKIFFTVLRTAIGIGLAVFLIHLTLKGADISIAALWKEQITQGNVFLLIFAFFVHGVIFSIAVLRWLLLLRAQQIDIGYLTTFRLGLIGFFFNLAIPGAVGGDLVKIGYAIRQAPNRKTAAVFSIAIDRLMGLLGLLIVAAFAVIFNWRVIAQMGAESPYLQGVALLVGFGSVAAIFGFIALEYHDRFLKNRRLQPLWDFGRRKLPETVTEITARILQALELYKRSKATLAKALIMSICVHSLLALNLFAIGRALGEDQLSIGEYFMTTQVANAIASVPITPGGLGLRDKGTQEFFGALGMTSGKSGAIPVTLTLIILSWALIGGIVFAVAPITPRLPDKHES